MVAQRQMHRHLGAPNRLQQVRRQAIVARLPAVEGAIAGDEDASGTLRQREQFARHAREMVRHIYAVRQQATVGGEMDVGQQRPGIWIGALAGSEEAGTEREGGATRQGPDQEPAARNGWQMNRHRPFLRVPGRSLKPKVQLGCKGEPQIDTDEHGF